MDMTAGDTVEPWEPQHRANVQTDTLAGNALAGGSVKIKPQGNIECSLPLHSMVVTFATAALALTASRTVATALLNNQVNLKVTEGAEVQYFPNAVCRSLRANVQGASVIFNMDFSTQMVTAVEPA